MQGRERLVWVLAALVLVCPPLTLPACPSSGPAMTHVAGLFVLERTHPRSLFLLWSILFLPWLLLSLFFNLAPLQCPGRHCAGSLVV